MKAHTRILNWAYVRDRRDDAHVLTAKKSKRRKRHWRRGMILDQGDTPTCVGHAWAGWLLAPPQHFLNPVGLYLLSQHRDEYEGENYEGTSVRGGASVLKSLGLVSAYEWVRTIDALVYALLEHGPIVAGTAWYAGMDDGGVMHPTGENYGGHAYLLNGINLDTGLIEMVNSWNADWGDNGCAKIPIDDFAQLMDEDGEACLASEATPQPSAKVAKFETKRRRKRAA